MIGGHFIKGWSRTQNHVTTSSAEAELYAMVKCTAELLGIRSMLRDFGADSSGVVYADSSAALAIAKRKGAGKLRHINANCLWIQERPDEKDLELRKVLGIENPADLMTKHRARQPLDKCMLQLNQHRTSGRARTGLDVQGTSKASEGPVPTLSGDIVAAGRLKEDSQPPTSGCTESRLGSSGSVPTSPQRLGTAPNQHCEESASTLTRS